MPKNVKREKIDAAKAKAPAVPGNTCPSIDYVQEIIDQIANRGDDWAEKQAGVITIVVALMSPIVTTIETIGER